MLKIGTLNLRHGGTSRIAGISDYLRLQRGDVTVCTEYRENAAGRYLTDRLADNGRVAIPSIAPDAKANGVMIIAPHGATVVDLDVPIGERSRVAACMIGDVLIVGVYFSQGRSKAPLFDFLIDLARSRQTMMVIGDFNTGLHRIDENGATFYCADLFRDLSTVRLTDLWRHVHGEDARQHSWVSAKGNPFRIDHALGTADVRDRVVGCHYDHAVRGVLSDHSALWMELAE